MRPIPNLPHVAHAASTGVHVIIWAVGIINVGLYIWLLWLGIAAMRRGE